MKLPTWFKTRFNSIKGCFYTGLGIILSATCIGLQSSSEPMFVSSIFDIGFENITNVIVKSTSGYLERTSNEGEDCILTIVMPFDFPPPAISEQYLCSWKDTGHVDSLCYTTFDCKNMDMLFRLGIVAPCLFLIGYIILGSLMFFSKKVSPKIYTWISLFGAGLILTSFIIAKSTPYITDYLLQDVFSKIREVTIFKGGVNYLEFETIKYVLGSRSSVARTLMDILAGLSTGFLIMLVDVYRRTFG